MRAFGKPARLPDAGSAGPRHRGPSTPPHQGQSVGPGRAPRRRPPRCRRRQGRCGRRSPRSQDSDIDPAVAVFEEQARPGGQALVQDVGRGKSSGNDHEATYSIEGSEKSRHEHHIQFLPRMALNPAFAITKPPANVPAIGVGIPARTPSANPLASAEPVSSLAVSFCTRNTPVPVTTKAIKQTSGVSGVARPNVAADAAALAPKNAPSTAIKSTPTKPVDIAFLVFNVVHNSSCVVAVSSRFEEIDAPCLQTHFQPRVGRGVAEVAIIYTCSRAVNLTDDGYCEAQLRN